MTEILIFVAIALLIWWAIRRKWITGMSKYDFGTPPHQPSERFQDYDAARERTLQRKEVDRVLEKIAEQGIQSISPKERKLLDAAAKREKRHQ